jgi:hypothetical protein
VGTDVCEVLSGLRMPRTFVFPTYLPEVFQDLERLVRKEEDLARVEWALTFEEVFFFYRT